MSKPKDLPRDQLIASAEEALRHYPGAELHFTCEKCGQRCMLAEPNMLYESGECDQCGHISPIQAGGFSLWFGPNFWDNRPSAKS